MLKRDGADGWLVEGRIGGGGIAGIDLEVEPLGRVTASNQVTYGVTYPFTYSYNLAGSLTSEKYPSSRLVNTCYDGANRVAQVTLNACTGSTGNYASFVQYAPHGAESQYAMGNNMWRNMWYNSRLQLYSSADLLGDTWASAWLSEVPNWGSTQNNGNLQGVTYYYGGFASLIPYIENFTYDGLNRLTKATDGGANGVAGWSRSYAYDAYGNMTPSGNPTPPAMSFNANNQLNGQSYDQAGNLLTANGNTLGYDYEGHVVSETDGVSRAVETYVFDGDGQRVEKYNASGRTIFVYDALGRMAMEVSPSATIPSCLTCYLSTDHLGTARMVTDENGSVVGRHDYLPFGEEVAGNTFGRDGSWGLGNDAVRQKFTAKERDSESGLDYFGARYYGSALGRFTSPDEPFIEGDLGNPQTLNLYAYGHNNPLRYVDPDGRAVRVCLNDENGKQTCTVLSDSDYAAARQNNAGVNAPVTGGNVGIGGGTITCGGQVCGSASYVEEGMQDTSGDLVVVAQAARGLAVGGVGLGSALVRGVAGLFAKEAAETAAKLTVQDILSNAVREGGSSAQIFAKGGGVSQAAKDFADLDGGPAITAGKVQIKELSNGQGRAVLRTDPSTFSTDGRPSLDIQPTGGGYKGTAIRYNP